MYTNNKISNTGNDNILLQNVNANIINIGTDNRKLDEILNLLKSDKPLDKSHYEILNRTDNSSGTTRRGIVRVLVETITASSKEAMKLIIPKINGIIKNDKYYKTELAANSIKNKACDVIWLIFYKNLIQYKNGLPFCQTLWIKKDLKDKPFETKQDEYIDDIGIIWNDNSSFDKMLEDNVMDKGDYIRYADNIFRTSNNLFIDINIIHQNLINSKINFNMYQKSISKYLSKLEELYKQSSISGYPPIECSDLDNKRQSVVANLHNITLVINDNTRSSDNIIDCMKTYLSSAEVDLQHFKYEREKIR